MYLRDPVHDSQGSPAHGPHQYSLPEDFRAFFGALDYAVIGRKL